MGEVEGGEEGGICCMIHTPACPCQTGEETAVKEE